MSLLSLTPPIDVVSRPFWHRPEPRVAMKEIDPGFELLRKSFPRTWEGLLTVKSLLDGMAVLETFPFSREGTEAQEHLARQAALVLAGVADQEEDARPELASCAREGAQTLGAYARTGRWPTSPIRRPSPSEPWLYCGPLGTWGRRATRVPVSLLVTLPDPARQAYVDTVDANLDTVRRVVADALEGEVRMDCAALPAMNAARLVLAGGETSFGHKNFAHFFPLEVPDGEVHGEDFTVVFTNVHQARFEACSLPLFSRLADRRPENTVERLLEASLVWFRCHDLGHFWRLVESSEPVGRTGDSPPFEKMALEESYADSLGLLSAAALLPDPLPLEEAYSAELLRYLSRDPQSFGDTVAAVIELGRLTEEGLDGVTTGGPWLAKSADVLADHARLIHDTLWGAGLRDPGCLAQSYAVGREAVERFAPVFELVPTDIDYVWG
ncbi:hypothetical protein ACIRVF_17495 [Kitasatospora sp. NPDC101157]|uniref:hypothetical protein n=1 Tax=Kitasatospora sp. NPDC101157 TaxID=3364098 RepID=UPI00380390FB